jgi:hypothetical protein
VSTINFQKGASIATMDNVMTRYPLPPKKGAKKEEKKKEPVIPEPKIIPPETVEQAQSKTLSWNYAANI